MATEQNDSASEPTAKKSNSLATFFTKILPLINLTACVLHHVAFSFNPPLLRFFQAKRKIPTLSLLVCVHVLPLAIYIPRLLQLMVSKRMLQKTNLQFAWLTMKREVLLSPTFYAFVAINYSFSLTFAYSARFAQVYLIPLIMLPTPIVVSITCVFMSQIHRLFLQRYYKIKEPKDVIFASEKLDFFCVLCMLATIAGGILCVVGSFGQQPATSWFSCITQFILDFSKMTLGVSDLVGIILAIGACITQGFLFVVIAFAKIQSAKANAREAGIEGSQRRVLFENGEYTWVMQCVLHLFLLIPSLAFEDWSYWLKLPYMDWIQFLELSIFVYLISNVLGIYGSVKLGPMVMSALLPIRLVVVLIIGAIVLNEYLQTIWQLVGMAVVVIGIVLFFVFKKRLMKKNQKKLEEKMSSSFVELNDQHVNHTDPSVSATAATGTTTTVEEQEEQEEVGQQVDNLQVVVMEQAGSRTSVDDKESMSKILIEKV